MLSPPSTLLTSAWPYLNHDFVATLALPSVASFLAAGARGYYDTSGVYQSASTNTPRFDNNPSSLVALGFQVELASQNLAPRSAALDDAAWTKAGTSPVAVTANQATAPDGTVSMDQLTGNAVNSDRIQQSITIAASTAYAISAFLRNVDSIESKFHLSATHSGTTGKEIFPIWASATAGAAISGFDTAAGSFVAINGGVSRIWIGFTSDSSDAGAAVFRLYPLNALNALRSINAWGLQLEPLLFPTSYIATGAAAATRAADVCTIAVRPGAGSLVVQALAPNNSTPILQIDDGTETNRITLSRDSSGNFVTTVVAAGVTVATLTQGALSTSTHDRLAVSWDTNSFKSSLNRGALMTDSSGALPSNLNICRFAATSAGVSGAAWYKTLRINGGPLSDTDLQAA